MTDESNDGFRAARVLLATCILGTVILGLASNGVYHDDDLTHFLFARWARWFPEYLLHIWGRPGFTIPVALVSWVNDTDSAWRAARLLSACVTAVSTYIALQLARDLGIRRLWTVVLFAYLQPLNTMLAATTLTENFTALYLVAAVRLLQRSQFILASVVFSLTLVTRHEMAALVPVWVVAVWFCGASLRQKTVSTALVLWAPIAHELLYFLVFEDWLVRIFLTPHGSTEYVAKDWLSYVPQALMAITPTIMGLAIAGGLKLWLKRNIGRLLIALAAIYLAIHIAITALGVFASGGYGRFMVSIFPLIAVLASGAVGLGEVNWRALMITTIAVWVIGYTAIEMEIRAGRFSQPDPWMLQAARVFVCALILAGLGAMFTKPSIAKAARGVAIAILGISVAIQISVLVRPMRVGPSHALVKSVAEWLEHNENANPVFATHPWLSYYLEIAENPRAHKGAQLLASMPVGTVLVWDSVYSPSDFHGLKLKEIRESGAYRELAEFRSTERSRSLHLVLLKKIAPTPIPPASSSYPPRTWNSTRTRTGEVLHSHR